MLSNRHIYSEVETAEKVREGLKSEYEKSMLKMAILNIKLLHNIRTNMTTMMKFFKIPLVEPEDKEQTKE
jgi:hypothetical protein